MAFAEEGEEFQSESGGRVTLVEEVGEGVVGSRVDGGEGVTGAGSIMGMLVAVLIGAPVAEIAVGASTGIGIGNVRFRIGKGG
jgi:uncharacterized membrane protein